LNIHKKIIFTLHYIWESKKFHLEPLHLVSHLVEIYRKQNKTLSDKYLTDWLLWKSGITNEKQWLEKKIQD